MARTEGIKKPRYGFYKKPHKVQFFTYLEVKDAATLDSFAEQMGLGQGTLGSWILEEILRSDDLQRVMRVRIENRPEIESIRKLSDEYQKSARKGREGFPYQTFSERRVQCIYCGKRQAEHFMNEHVRRLCPKAPHVKALPEEILLRAGQDMEVDAE